jgi:hypothetical protein
MLQGGGPRPAPRRDRGELWHHRRLQPRRGARAPIGRDESLQASDVRSVAGRRRNGLREQLRVIGGACERERAKYASPRGRSTSRVGWCYTSTAELAADGMVLAGNRKVRETCYCTTVSRALEPLSARAGRTRAFSSTKSGDVCKTRECASAIIPQFHASDLKPSQPRSEYRDQNSIRLYTETLPSCIKDPPVP